MRSWRQQPVLAVAAVAGIAGFVYALLWLRQPFENEVHWFLQVRGQGEPIYLRPAWRAVLARADALALAGPHTLVCWLSATCVALGLFAFGLGVRRVLPDADPRRATAVLASGPAVLCGATTAQPYGIVFALAGLAFLLASFQRARGGWCAVALAGACAGSAYAFDVSALLVAAWLLPFVYWQARRGRLGTWRASAYAAVGAATWVATVCLVCARDWAPTPATEVMLAAGNAGHARDALRLLEAFGEEFVRAFLPLSVVVLACACKPRGQLARITLFAAMLGCIASAWLRGLRSMEGVLQLSLALPAALVAIRHLGARGQVMLIVTGAALALMKREALAGNGQARDFYSGLRAEVGSGDPLLLTSGGGPDHTACALWLPRVINVNVAEIIVFAEQNYDGLRTLVQENVGRAFADGRQVFLTHDAETMLRSLDCYDQHPSAAVFLQAIRQSFQLVQREQGGFRAKELLPRS
jgi:hypothetical protein